MSKSFSGRCLCGDVEFEISGRFESFFLCHCSRCRKGTGSAHAANLFTSTAEITWVKGKDRVTSFQVPNTRHSRSFCSRCGSALPRVQMNGNLIVVPAGCLDSSVDIRPNAHICYSSRADWDERLDQVEKLDGLPGQ
ncbi:GFA family protein [Boseongicola sp. H5]|uniref:GFA family protein n=1 Tax=Boseongicola sp. H5 TaxID=2763261 RepID=UPI001D0B9920|nr:GFA family protein [Boseongicola sp. H5]